MKGWDLVVSMVLAAATACAGGPPGITPSEPPPGESQGDIPAEGGAGGAEPGPPAGGADAGVADPSETAVAVEEIRDETGRVYRVDQGERGEPARVGCADGQRELFVNAVAFPRIAGCLGQWKGLKSMRARPTGRACGDDAGPCAVPSDVCAPGWRACGAAGAIADLKQVTGKQCERAGGGRFSAAISHCEKQSGCIYDTRPDGDYDCFRKGWCSETVCCGADCGDFGACSDGVWPDRTHISAGPDQSCGATAARRAGGVLCCRD